MTDTLRFWSNHSSLYSPHSSLDRSAPATPPASCLASLSSVPILTELFGNARTVRRLLASRKKTIAPHQPSHDRTTYFSRLTLTNSQRLSYPCRSSLPSLHSMQPQPQTTQTSLPKVDSACAEYHPPAYPSSIICGRNS
jgi:hypothetical protein